MWGTRRTGGKCPNVGFTSHMGRQLGELQKTVDRYQDKLSSVTEDYQQKIGILEDKIVRKDLGTF